MMMREQVVSLKAKAEERDNVIKLQQQQIEELSTVLAKTSNELVTAELKVQEYRSDLQDMTKAYQDHLDAESKTIYNTVVRKLREQKDWVVHKFSQ
jgi:chromosome segregation ATPase